MSTYLVANCQNYQPIVLGQLAAFPGAQGMGAIATGGRGGVVYTVNSLEDTYSEGQKYPTPNNGASGATCTLRDALQASGARTIVFSVSGTITLHGPVYPIYGNLTIAGHTSPGGIQVKLDGTFGNSGAMLNPTEGNIIMRYMRLRPGPAPYDSGGDGATSIEGINGPYIYDHCSFEWSSNKPVAWTSPISNVTLSWNLMAEGTHTGPLINHSYASDSQTDLDNSSFDGHHNIFATFDHRLPYTNNKYFRWINNLTFGYNYAGLVRGNVHCDIVGNVFDGISSNITSDSGHKEFRWADTVAHNEGNLVPGGDIASFYMANNFGPNNPTGTLDNYNTMLRLASDENSQLNDNVVSATYKSTVPTSMPFGLTTHPITINTLSSYTDLKGILSPTIGAYQKLDPAGTGALISNRDSLDTTILNYIANPATSPSTLIADTGSNTYAGTYPTLTGGSYPTCSQNDGIPDSWKTSHGLSTSNANIRNTILSGANGYTVLELYLSGLFPNGTPLPSS